MKDKERKKKGGGALLRGQGELKRSKGMNKVVNLLRDIRVTKTSASNGIRI